MSFNALGDIESSIPVSPLHLAVSVSHLINSCVDISSKQLVDLDFLLFSAPSG